MKRTINIVVDLKNKMYNTIYLKQMDTTVFEVKIVDDNQNINMTEQTVDIIFTKPDNTIVQQLAAELDIENSIAKIPLLASCLRQAGKAKMEIEVKNTNSEIISSFYIPIVIEKTSKENIVSEDMPLYFEEYSKAIDALKEDSKELIENLTEIDETARINENKRIEAEEIRVNNETIREDAEQTRINDETERNAKEELRINEENARITAENSRIQKETERINAEVIRNKNEASRIEEFEEIKNNLNVQKINEIETELNNLNTAKVDKTTTIAGVDLQNNITASELANAIKTQINTFIDTKMKGTSLYDNTTGTGSLTLSQNASTFSYLEIFWKVKRSNTYHAGSIKWKYDATYNKVNVDLKFVNPDDTERILRSLLRMDNISETKLLKAVVVNMSI